ncbi:MAG: HAMP domain-containing sensor histidine kinase [Acidimicrobiia bacterium]
MKIRWRLTWYGIGLTALALLGFLILIILLAQATASDEQDALLSAIADDAAESISTAQTDVFDIGVPPFAPDSSTSDQPFTTVYDEQSVVVFATGTVNGSPLVLPDDVQAEAWATGAAEATIDEVRSQIRTWTNPNLGNGLVAASQTTRVVEDQLVGARGFLAAFAFIALLAAAIGAWFMAKRALRPLRELADTTDEIGSTGDLSRRLPDVSQEDEVGDLTSSFNAMLASLEEARSARDQTIEGQKRFVADASHELRSPLTSIAANAGFLLDHSDADPSDIAEATSDIATSAARMAELIDGLIVLARSDEAQTVHLEPVDLRTAISAVMDGVPQTSGLVITSDVLNAVIVDGDLDQIEQVLRILVDNASRHGATALSISAEVGDNVVLYLDDNGPGVEESQREAIFERFYRADPARSGPGYGLGLSIAASIVATHNGSISVGAAPAGGARFQIVFPTLT